MSLSKGVEIHQLTSVKAGMIQFYTPQSSNETMLVQIPPNTIDDMFVHKYQTDQLMVVRGNFILVVLHDGKYQYIPLSDAEPQVVTIPQMVPHSAINIGNEPCMIINAVIRHGESHPADYRPIKAPFPYDLSQINRYSSDQNYSIAA
jgi:mannose-6-phosphate isomerase-like protein (cupin superfamily)